MRLIFNPSVRIIELEAWAAAPELSSLALEPRRFEFVAPIAAELVVVVLVPAAFDRVTPSPAPTVPVTGPAGIPGAPAAAGGTSSEARAALAFAGFTGRRVVVTVSGSAAGVVPATEATTGAVVGRFVARTSFGCRLSVATSPSAELSSPGALSSSSAPPSSTTVVGTGRVTRAVLPELSAV
jgi:hypothetical protein